MNYTLQTISNLRSKVEAAQRTNTHLKAQNRMLETTFQMWRSQAEKNMLTIDTLKAWVITLVLLNLAVSTTLWFVANRITNQ